MYRARTREGRRRGRAGHGSGFGTEPLTRFGRTFATTVLAMVLVLFGVTGQGVTASAAPIGTSAPHGSLTVWSYMSTPEIAAVNSLAQTWAQQTGNKVQVVQGPGGFQTYASAAHSGKGPDMVFGMPDDNLGDFHAAGLLSKVPKGILKTSAYAKAAVQAVSYSGTPYAVPIELESIALFYNKKLVPHPPSSFAQVVSDAKTLQSSGKYGFEYDINNFYYSAAILSGFGGYIFKQNSNGSLNPQSIGLDNKGAVQGLTYIQNFVKQGLMPADITGNIVDAHFSSGQLGMMLDGPWDVSTYEKAGLDFGVEPLPVLPNGHYPKPFLGTYAGFVSNTVSSTNQHLSWSLMQYLMKHDGGPLLQAGNRIPALSSAQAAARHDDPRVVDFFAATAHAQPLPNIPEMSAVWTPGANNLTLLTKGQETPQQAGAAMVKQIQQGVAQMQ